MSTSDAIRIAHLSDTHFVEEGADAEGGFAYNTAEAFAAVQDHLEANQTADMVVITGDIADHGRPAQYRRAAEAFAGFTAPVNVCPGNHDQDAAFTAGVGRPGVGTSRVIEAGNWCFLFVDSNAGIMVKHETGRYVDPPDYADRLHRNGSLGQREASWIADTCTETGAEHVFIWLHHPPAPRGGTSNSDGYANEWRNLLRRLPKVRGMGGGHTHVPTDYLFEERPVYVSPALKHNFDLDAKTWLPPGYRTYNFAPDGTIAGEVCLIDDPRWPRKPAGRAVISLLTGALSQADFDAIVARKQAELNRSNPQQTVETESS